MNTRLSWVGSLLLVFGVAMFAMSLLGLYRLDSELSDKSEYLLIDSNSNGVVPFFHVQTGDMKQVEVIVIQGPAGYSSVLGNTTQVLHPFEITLLSLGIAQSSFTTDIGLAAGPVRHIFDFPEGWTSLDGVRISNPENNPVTVTVTIIFHRQVMDTSLQAIMYLGLSLAGIGAIAIGFAVHKSRRRLSQ
jgi:hypothetical protein